MALLLNLFLITAAVLWFSVFGYIFALNLVAFRQRRTQSDLNSLPEITVVIPTLNEEELILKKLEDLWRTDYPHELITVVVVDGGSVDRTTEVIRDSISRGEPIQLLCVNGSQGRTDQILHAFGRLTHEVVVVTDADSVLDPSCIRELVSVLEQDPQTAIIGAMVRPVSALLEERIHWWILNFLWWLEGEVLSSAGVSGVCYACRRQVVLDLVNETRDRNIRLPFAASSGGYRVRISRQAHAMEVRVPQSRGELLRFRRRRGLAYLSELRSSWGAHAPTGCRIARFMRLWHFLIVPKMVVLLCAFALFLLFTPYVLWLSLMFTVFLLSALAVLLASIRLTDDNPSLWRLSVASGRLVLLILTSMLMLNIDPLVRTTRGLK